MLQIEAFECHVQHLRVIRFDEPSAPRVVIVSFIGILWVANGSVVGVSQAAADSFLVLAVWTGEASDACATVASHGAQVGAISAVQTWTRCAWIAGRIAQRRAESRWTIASRHRPVLRASSAISAPQRKARIQRTCNASARSKTVSGEARFAETHRRAVWILNALGVFVADTAISTLVIGAY